MKIHFTILIAFISYLAHGQDYLEYQRTFNRIDNDIIAERLDSACIRLDSIYNRYPFIYAKHCIKALQICCVNNDPQQIKKWINKCFLQGVPLWVIRNNEITSSLFHNDIYLNPLCAYDSLHNVYLRSLNSDIAKTIDSLYELDQKITHKVNKGFILFRHTIYGLQWMRNNKKQFEIISRIINTYGFPGEKLIGLPKNYNDSESYFRKVTFYGPSLFDYRTYIMLIHYFSNPRKDINQLLLFNVIKGYLPSEQYGAINDFMAKWGRKKYGNFPYYNVWHHDPTTENLSEIDQRRHQIGLNSFEEQIRNNQISIQRRKNKQGNSTILLE